MSESLSQRIAHRLLPRVKTPAQYIGGEVNQPAKVREDAELRVALAFPDTYAVGMSNVGLAILYEAVNRLDGVVAERVFCPWPDAAEVMRQEGIGLFSWDSHRLVADFDILGVSLQHELAYSNILYLLDLAGLPFRSAHRDERHPLVVGGGPLADCCEPVAEFFDVILPGDGEEIFPLFIEYYRRLRRQKTPRREMLVKLARHFDCVYVPDFYEVNYFTDGRLQRCEPTVEGIPRIVKRSQVKNLDEAAFPTSPLVAHTECIHDRIAIEVMRGCPQRCVFCHAGHTRGKVRIRSVERILEIAQKSYQATGHDTISLLSLSTSDYPHLRELTQRLYAIFAEEHVGISLPSLRVDKQLKEVPASVADVRREGLTLAVEAARDPLRRAIGKKLTDEDLLATMRQAYQAGWRKVKLYFIVGFPGETPEDIEGIVDLSARISALRREVAGGPATVNVTISWLVPKPHTPLAWAPQQGREYFQQVRRRLLDAKYQLRGVSIKLKFHNIERSLLEAVFARGDRCLSSVLEEAYRLGARFDAWDECFRPELYEQAMAKYGLEESFYAHRERDTQELLPWTHLCGENLTGLITRWQQFKEFTGFPGKI
ncbi:MAG: TIGR03960 family B12-binding radical SAM protein [Sedimentisphaerales bacterium]|nr:TIGR03960 family B12-binding radical SAM protein [Sedimentisphaerales bacterium]